MQRRVMSELVVAFIVLGMLALAIVFAGLLSVSTAQPEPTPTETQTPTHTLTSTPMPTETPTVTSSPTLTMTVSPTHTVTVTPSATATLTATETPTATPTATSTPTLTASATPTATETELPITTPRPIDAAAIRALFADVVQTLLGGANNQRSTSVASAATTGPALHPTTTVVYTLTSTPTATATLTASPAITPTKPPTATATLTVSPTTSPTIIPTETPIIIPEQTITPVACVLPPEWVTYHVRTGDTLFRIALRTGSSVSELRRVNCLSNVDYLYIGQLLFVPGDTARPSSTIDVNSPDREQIDREGCGLSDVQITSPVPLQRVSGRVTFYGTAQSDDFAYYRVDVRADAEPVYQYYTDAIESVVSRALFVLDTRKFSRGLYWVRLSVVDQQGFVDEQLTCAIPIFFD